MDLKLSVSAEEFLSWYRKIMEANDAETQLFLTNLQNYAINGALTENVMGGIYDQGELILIFLNAAPWNLLIFELKESREACEKLAKFLVENKISIAGINASFNIGLFFREAYTEQSRRLFTLRTAMDIMVLKKLNDIPLSAGSAELAKPEDADLLAEYLVNFNFDCFHQTHEKTEFLELVNKKNGFRIALRVSGSGRADCFDMRRDPTDFQRNCAQFGLHSSRFSKSGLLSDFGSLDL